MNVTASAPLPVADGTMPQQQNGLAAEGRLFDQLVQLQLVQLQSSGLGLGAHLATPAALGSEIVGRLRDFIREAHRSDALLKRTVQRAMHPSSGTDATALETAFHPGPASEPFEIDQWEYEAASQDDPSGLSPVERSSALAENVIREIDRSMIFNLWQSLVAHGAMQIPRSVRVLLQSQ